MLLLGQIKNKYVIGLGQEQDFGEHKCFSSCVICKLWLLERVSLGEGKGLPLTCGSLSSSPYPKEVKGQHALSPTLRGGFPGPSLLPAVVPSPPVVLVMCRKVVGKELLKIS